MDCDAKVLPIRADPNVTRITYNEPATGCCLPLACCACAKERSCESPASPRRDA